MARYLILIYGDEKEWEAMSPQQLEAHMAAHDAFSAAAGPAILGGAELQPSVTATSLRAGADGRPAPTDGPFLETKEVLGGYYLIEAPDLDAAIALAGRLPEVAGSPPSPATGPPICCAARPCCAGPFRCSWSTRSRPARTRTRRRPCPTTGCG